MAIRIVNNDILNATQNVIIHQVNCQGRMGAGVAKAISTKWPIVRKQYLEFCKGKAPEDLLGKVNLVKINNSWGSDCQYVANAFAQLDFRKKYDVGNKCYTDYDAFRKCMDKIVNEFGSHGISYAMPYGIGCGLAGGRWDIIMGILEDIFYTHDLVLYDINNASES